jgi:hypothetical protein
VSPDQKLVLAHIVRDPIPWETGEPLTECGHAASEMARIVTREQVRDRVRVIGSQRAHYEFCMTCTQTADRWSTWEQDPLNCLHRLPNSYYGSERSARGKLLRSELRAVALVVRAHWDEYLATLEQVRGTSSLTDARIARRRRAGRIGR